MNKPLELIKSENSQKIYKIDFHCQNCNSNSPLEIPYGTPFLSTTQKCPKCGVSGYDTYLTIRGFEKSIQEAVTGLVPYHRGAREGFIQRLWLAFQGLVK